MSSSKRQRTLHDEDVTDMPECLTGKLLDLQGLLLEDGFNTKLVEETLANLLPIYNRWLHPLNARRVDRRLRTNQGLHVELSSNAAAVSTALKLMDDDAAAVRRLSQVFQSLPDYSCNSDSAVKLVNITRGILQSIWYTRMNLFSYLRIVHLSSLDVSNFNEETNRDSRDGVYWFDRRLQDDQAAVDKRERLISHLLFHFSIRGYRKVEGDPDYVYTQKEITISEGSTFNTFTWERRGTLRQAIYELCRKEEQSELWNITLAEREVINAESYLKNCIDHEFPAVEFHRRKYSFRDGVYDGETDRFALYTDGVLNTFPELSTYGTFMFIDQPFTQAYALEPRGISCPAFESIMTMQGWSNQCIEMMYILIGRLMHNVGEKDNWQIMPYLIGEAGTGKSTIIDTVQKLIPQPMVGVFGSGGEAQFGSQDWDKLALIVFPEVKPSEFKKSMPLGKWFSLIAGDSVCLPAKFKAPRYVPKFPTHMIAAGNEAPEWGDPNGAFSRRTACFPFRVKLTQRNPDLPKHIDTELPKILRKALLSYYDALERFAGKDLWSVDANGKDIMPVEIRDESRRMQKATTPILDFLLDKEYVELDPDAEVSREEFIKTFDIFIKTVRHGYPLRWSEELYGHAFQMLKLTVEGSEDGDIIRGVRLKKTGI